MDAGTQSVVSRCASRDYNTGAEHLDGGTEFAREESSTVHHSSSPGLLAMTVFMDCWIAPDFTPALIASKQATTQAIVTYTYDAGRIFYQEETKKIDR